MDITAKIGLFNSLITRVREGGFSSVIGGIVEDNHNVEISDEVIESILVSFLENVVIQLENGDDFEENVDEPEVISEED